MAGLRHKGGRGGGSIGVAHLTRGAEVVLVRSCHEVTHLTHPGAAKKKSYINYIHEFSHFRYMNKFSHFRQNN